MEVVTHPEIPGITEAYAEMIDEVKRKLGQETRFSIDWQTAEVLENA